MTEKQTKSKRPRHPVRVQVSGPRLVGELHHHGKTLQWLAYQLGVSRETIKQWNRIGWPEDKFYALAVSFDVDNIRVKGDEQ
jgi:lambda repressor-like predicted transcriptional regulator